MGEEDYRVRPRCLCHSPQHVNVVVRVSRAPVKDDMLDSLQLSLSRTESIFLAGGTDPSGPGDATFAGTLTFLDASLSCFCVSKSSRLILAGSGVG